MERRTALRWSSAGLVSAAVHICFGACVATILVRTPTVAPAIRVSLYAPPAPAQTSGDGSALSPSVPEHKPAAPARRPKPIQRAHHPVQHARKFTATRQPIDDGASVTEPAPRSSEECSVNHDTDGPAGRLAGGSFRGEPDGIGNAIISADKAALRPEPISEVMPEYPPAARARGIEGQVVLQAVVTTDGQIEPNITVVQSVPLLDAAAIRALRQWRFLPARDHNGTPVRVSLRLPVRFVLR